MIQSLAHRFAKRVTPGMTGDCWGWTGAKNNRGYGTLTDGKTRLMAHRISYELHRGPIPDGMEIDHLCRNRWCVCPEHLEAVTHKVNLSRGMHRVAGPPRPARTPAIRVPRTPAIKLPRPRATTCRNGHARTPENTYTMPNGKRMCRPCNTEWHRRQRMDRPHSSAH